MSPCRARKADAAPDQLRLAAFERPRDAEGGVDGAPRVILVGDGRPEERHDAVAEELVHRALVAVDLGEHEIEGVAHEPMHFLGIEPLRERGEARHVHEKHRDLLPLAGEGAARGENLLGEVPRRVGLRGGKTARRGLAVERPAAIVTEAIAWWVARLAARADDLEPRPAASAEADARGIRMAAARTGHGRREAI